MFPIHLLHAAISKFKLDKEVNFFLAVRQAVKLIVSQTLLLEYLSSFSPKFRRGAMRALQRGLPDHTTLLVDSGATHVGNKSRSNYCGLKKLSGWS